MEGVWGLYGCGFRWIWVCIGYLGVGYGVGGCGADDVGGWGWVPCFALEYVELGWLLHEGLAWLPSLVGSAGCYWGLYVGTGASGCCMFCERVSLWGGEVALAGSFRRVLC